MHILRWIFKVHTIAGCSQTSDWTSPNKKFLYTVYTFVLFVLIHSLCLTQILDIVFNVNSQDEFSENIYLTVGVFVSCFKMWNLLHNRENYAVLISKLEKKPLLPVNTEEIEIRAKFDKMAEWNAIVYMTVAGLCIGWMIPSSFLKDFRYRKLSYRIWLPYNYSSSFVFAITYSYQAAGVTIGAFANVACDSLFSGLLIHTYSQFEILRYRLNHIVKNKKDSAKKCAHLHNHIYKFAVMINEKFKTMVFIQFVVSISLCCVNLYRLNQVKMNSKLIDLTLIICCLLIQILYYCWYGNEIKVKSLQVSDMVIESNWMSLDNDAKKILIMIMRRATVPIEFNTMHLLSINLECFKTIIKTSYSAFNMLQQT
ncbi:odorant receptor 94a-like [Colletes latitarsis]|uniref:odorant receptor 94a-like n=1 Tax=Colletes latitarsis TaxID=2605962 RepID=UPI0040367AB8